MVGKPQIVILAPQAQCDEILSGDLDDDFHLVTTASLQEVLKVADEKKRVELIVVYTESLAEDCSALRSEDALRDVPVVAVGRYGSEKVQNASIHAGAIDYVDLGNLTMPVFDARIRCHYDLKHRSDMLTEVARIDSRTAVPNRYYFEEAIDVEWRRCCREFTSLSLIMIDIDAFAKFNEHYGAGVGDNCLKRVAAVIENNCLRAADLVARYDSDEFVAILPGTEFENAMRVAENICRAVAAVNLIHEYSDSADRITVSAGLATIDPTQDQDVKILIAEVEEMLGNAQAKGGNCAQGVAL